MELLISLKTTKSLTVDTLVVTIVRVVAKPTKLGRSMWSSSLAEGRKKTADTNSNKQSILLTIFVTVKHITYIIELSTQMQRGADLEVFNCRPVSTSTYLHACILATPLHLQMAGMSNTDGSSTLVS